MEEVLEIVAPALRTAPCALLSYRTQEGERRILLADWVTVVCTRPAMLTVALRRPFELSGEAMQGDEFEVYLPSTACLAMLSSAGAYGPLPISLLADAPVRLQCRRGKVTRRFDREMLGADVSALYMNGRHYGRSTPPDLYRLKPFAHSLIASCTPSHIDIPESALGSAPCF